MTAPAVLSAEQILAILQSVAEVMAPAGYHGSAAIVLPEEQCSTVDEVARLVGVEPTTQPHERSNGGQYTIVAVCPVRGADVRVQSCRPARAVVAGGVA